MTTLVRACCLISRRLRRSKHAFVTSIGVILLVYVILASDVIPELKSFKHRSIVELRIKPPNLPISIGELQNRPRLPAANQSVHFRSVRLTNGQHPNNDTHEPPSQSRNVFHSPPEDPPPLHANSSRANANHSSLVVSYGHSSGRNNSNSSSSSSSSSSNGGSSNSGRTVFDITSNSSRKNETSNNNINSSSSSKNIDNNKDINHLHKNDQSKEGDDSAVVETTRQPGSSSEVLKGDHSEEGKVPAKGEAEGQANSQGHHQSSVLLAGVPKSRKVFLSVGMVTVKRDKADYFFNTLNSLLQHSSPDEQRELTIVVMLADRDQSRNDQVLRSIKTRYRKELQSGLLLVIRGPDTDFIFRNSDVKRTYDDSLQRVQWRSKQNWDYAAVIEFGANLSTYYLHIEDDVLSADNYIRHVREFILANQKVVWAILEVCPHGFIGKLFKTADLPKLVTTLRTFYLEQPCDFLINYFMHMMTQAKKIMRTAPLFFHQGKYSSLTNVTRKLDKLPGKRGKKFQVVKNPLTTPNPEAEVSSDLKIWDHHGVYNAYSPTSDFLWASDIKEGQRYTVTFAKDQRLKKLAIETGFSTQNPKDILYKGRVEMGTKPPHPSHPLLCPDARTVGKFQQGHFDIMLVPPHDIRCFSIVIMDKQTDWLIIREILVVPE